MAVQHLQSYSLIWLCINIKKVASVAIVGSYAAVPHITFRVFKSPMNMHDCLPI